MSQKLIFLDIDGTLTVAGENTPPKSALDAIRKTQAKGNLVFLCTGRNFGMLEPLLKYGFDGVIGCGGGIIKVKDKIIYDCPMTQEQTEGIIDILKRNGVFITIESKDIAYGDNHLSDFLGATNSSNSEIERWRKALSSQLGIRPMNEYDGRPIYKVVIMCENNEQLTEVKNKYEDQFHFAIQDVATHQCLNGDLVNRKFDKGQAIKRVCKYLNVSIDDTYGFGDSMNDLEMIETVHVGVCMENGSEKLKAISHMIAPRVEEDGLYRAFEQLELI